MIQTTSDPSESITAMKGYTTMKVYQRTRLTSRLTLAGGVTLALFVVFGHAARAQYLQTYFPPGVPGYGTSAGVTVMSRARPLYQSQGLQAGGFTVRPSLYEAFGYNSNPNGSNAGTSAFLQTSAAVSAESNWSRNALGVSLTADNYAYFAQPSQNYTNWAASLGGGYTIGSNNLSLGYSHLSLHQTLNDVGAVQSTTPVHYNVDDVRSDYTFDLGRYSVTPNIDVQNLTFDSATIQGKNVSQSYRNRVVVVGGVTGRYNLSDQRNLIVVLQGVDSNFANQVAGQPSSDSTGVLGLAGLDYQADGPWRYRLLAGLEQRSFTASQYKTHIAPIVVGQAIWTPTGLTTVTGSIARTIEAPASVGNSGFTYTTASVGADHELYRNILLQGQVSVQLAQYLQGGGSQTSYTLGAGASWLLNRNVRLSLNYTFTETTSSQATTFNGTPNITTTNSGPSSGNLAFLALHLGL